MTLDEYSGGRKRRKSTVKTAVRKPVRRTTLKRTHKPAVRRTIRHEGGKRKLVRRVRKSASVIKAEGEKRKYRRTKGKPRGDIHGAKYVGKRIKEETAKKGRKLNRVELSKLFKDAWAEYKSKKGR